MALRKIKSNTQIIAEFVGRKGKHRDYLYTFPGLADFNNGNPWYSLDKSKFKTDWNWLMAVVKKIKEVIEKEKLPEAEWMEQHLNPYLHEKTAIYKFSLEFIKKYNHDHTSIT